MSAIPGSIFLTSALNVISQSLLIPVIFLLLIFVVYAVITLGGLISEYTSRKKISIEELEELIHKVSNVENIQDIRIPLESSQLKKNQKEVISSLLDSEDLGKDSREALARRLMENEEDLINKRLEKTDIVTRLGPTLGLMGTLIPMGPGLAALGSGDVNTLAQAIIVAFDTTVVGLAAGGLSYFVSKIRRRWYEEYLSDLDSLIDVVLEGMNNG